MGAVHAVLLGVVTTLGAELLQLGLQTLLLGLGVLHGDQLQHLAQVKIVRMGGHYYSYLFGNDRQLVMNRNIFNLTDLLHVTIVLKKMLRKRSQVFKNLTSLMCLQLVTPIFSECLSNVT